MDSDGSGPDRVREHPARSRDEVNATIKMARELFRDGRLAEAQSAALEILEIAPDDLRAHNLIARIASCENRDDDALAHWHAVLRLCPTDPVAAREATKLLIAHQRPDEARTVLAEALDANPKDRLLLRAAARAAEAAGDPDSALALWQRFASEDGSSFDTKRKIARLNMKLGNYTEAERVISGSDEAKDNPTVAAEIRAEIAEKDGRVEDAARWALVVLEGEPANLKSARIAARALVRMNRAEEAYTIAATALAPGDEDNGLMLAAARAARASGRLTEALRLLEKLTAADPENFSAHLAQGQTLLSLGRRVEAAVSLSRAVAIRPEHTGARSALERCSDPPPGRLAIPGQQGTKPRVSVIIAARDMATFLPDALESLIAQTLADWEAIVVDDGSTDDTADIAQKYANSDPRIKAISTNNSGASEARNTGFSFACYDLILFLDADDWLLPDALKLLTSPLQVPCNIDVVYASSMRVSMDGQRLIARYNAPDPTDILDRFAANRSTFSIHACLTRKSIFAAAGGFDTTLAVGEDWDLWHRIAQSGAVFAAVSDVVACYRARPRSALTNADDLLDGVLNIIRRNKTQNPQYYWVQDENDGGYHRSLPEEAEHNLFNQYLSFCISGMVDPKYILDKIDEYNIRSIDPQELASSLVSSIPYFSGAPPTHEAKYWDHVESTLHTVTLKIESLRQQPGFAAAAARHLERRMARQMAGSSVATIGRTLALRIETTRPIEDTPVPPDVDWADIRVDWLGAGIDRLYIPVNGQSVGAGELIDEICARSSWILLGKFFGPTYRRLKLSNARGNSLWLDDDCIAEGLGTSVPDLDPDALHKTVGRTVFLRELVGCPQAADGPDDGLSIEIQSDGVGSHPAPSGAIAVELAHDLPRTIRVDDGCIDLDVRIGGEPFAIVRIVNAGNDVSGDLLAAVLSHVLDRDAEAIVVRHAILGRAEGDGASLRQRLLEAADAPRPTETSARSREIVVCVAHGHSSDRATPKPVSRHHFEAQFASRIDPWHYESSYEQQKYRQTLSLLPNPPARRALEIACAEGIFTEELAHHVEHLVATDISTLALKRARARVAADNVEFFRTDLFKDPIPGRFDAIICSEVLYYLQTEDALRAFVERIEESLEPGGVLITAHANLLVDDPNAPGVNWREPFGAAKIAGIISERLSLETELRTPFYRISRFTLPPAHSEPEIRQVTHRAPISIVAASFSHAGGKPIETPPQHATSTIRLPILMYHRVAETGAEATASWRVTPSQLEEHLAYLHDCGFRTVPLREWRDACMRRTPLDGDAIAITFDDGFRDFGARAWPILKRYGFSATLFVVAGAVGGTNQWDAAYGETIPLLDWQELRALAEDGVEIGSHSMTHRRLSGMTARELADEVSGSRALIEDKIGLPVQSFAMPYGDTSPGVEHVIRQSGYRQALNTNATRSSLNDFPFALPRIGITGSDDLETFIRRMLS